MSSRTINKILKRHCLNILECKIKNGKYRRSAMKHPMTTSTTNATTPPSANSTTPSTTNATAPISNSTSDNATAAP